MKIKHHSEWFQPELFSRIDFTNSTLYGQDPLLPNGVALEIKYRPNSPTKNSSPEKTVYKVYPINNVVVQDYSKVNLVQLGENIDTFFGQQYNIAYNSIDFIDPIEGELYTGCFPFYYFLAGNEIKFNPNMSISPINPFYFKVFNWRDAELDHPKLSSSSLLTAALNQDHPDNLIENILKNYNSELIDTLDFNKLNITQDSKLENEDLSQTPLDQLLTSGDVVNYPNPFNPSTTISFNLEKAGFAKLKVYDILGRIVFKTSIDAVQGNNQIQFNASKLSSGVYFYRLHSNEFTVIKKMHLLK